MSYFERHIFFCTNQRESGQACCGDYDASAARAHAKQRIKALGQSGEGKIRVNTAGCLDRCAEGPVVVVYPEAIWYTYIDNEDIDEIIDEHLLKGRLVERLKI